MEFAGFHLNNHYYLFKFFPQNLHSYLQKKKREKRKKKIDFFVLLFLKNPLKMSKTVEFQPSY